MEKYNILLEKVGNNHLFYEACWRIGKKQEWAEESCYALTLTPFTTWPLTKETQYNLWLSRVSRRVWSRRKGVSIFTFFLS